MTTGNLDDWSNVEGVTSALHSIHGSVYEEGEATFKCVHDGEMVYFSMEIPGDYRFDTESDKKCASIGTMMKMGSKAGFINMGGCEAALQGCDDGVPAECDDYRVGAYFESFISLSWTFCLRVRILCTKLYSSNIYVCFVLCSF